MIDIDSELQAQLAMRDADLLAYMLMKMNTTSASFSTAFQEVAPDRYNEIIKVINHPEYDRNR